MKKSIFYAVQHGENFDWDYGSENHDEALKMAKEMVKEERYDGEQISIAKIDVNDSFCLEEEIIRDVSTVDTTTDWDW